MTPTMNVAGLNAAGLLSLGRTVYIASFFPIEQKKFRPFKSKQEGGFNTWYEIPACAIDAKEPVVIAIGDALEHVYLGEKRHQDVPVPGGAMEIAKDLIQTFRDNAVGASEHGKPAIWICAGDGPTKEECQHWLKQQEAYFRNLLTEADSIYDKVKSGQNVTGDIGTLHRFAGRWLHVDVRNHKWMTDERRAELKKCPFCRADIDAESIKCVHCGEVVDPAAYRTLTNPVKPQPGQPIAPPVSKG